MNNTSMSDLLTVRDVLISYLRAKLVQEDWHAVRDVAVDIEILEARIKERKHIDRMHRVLSLARDTKDAIDNIASKYPQFDGESKEE